MAYVKVVEIEFDDAWELPLEEDGTLTLSTLTAQFASSTGLKYRADSGAFRLLKLSDGKIHPPPEGWNDLTYVAIFPKDVVGRPKAKKRKITAGHSSLAPISSNGHKSHSPSPLMEEMNAECAKICNFGRNVVFRCYINDFSQTCFPWPVGHHYLITAAHGFDGCILNGAAVRDFPIVFIIDGSRQNQYESTVIHCNRRLDIAVLKLSGGGFPADGPKLEPALVKQDETVFTIGFPSVNAKEPDIYPAVVSQQSLNWNTALASPGDDGDLMFRTFPNSGPGCSGAPIFNASKKWVGMFSHFTSDGSNSAFCVPAFVIITALDSVIRTDIRHSAPTRAHQSPRQMVPPPGGPPQHVDVPPTQMAAGVGVNQSVNLATSTSQATLVMGPLNINPLLSAVLNIQQFLSASQQHAGADLNAMLSNYQAGVWPQAVTTSGGPIPMNTVAGPPPSSMAPPTNVGPPRPANQQQPWS